MGIERKRKKGTGRERRGEGGKEGEREGEREKEK